MSIRRLRGTLYGLLRRLPLCRDLLDRRAQYLFARQESVRVTLAGIDMLIPERHHLPDILKREPFREHLLIASAEVLFAVPDKEYVDIGANIGFTASLVDKFAVFKPRMTLMEPSPFYLPYLAANTSESIGARIIPKYAASSSPPTPIGGSLHHWGGTAEIRECDESWIAPKDQMNVWQLVTAETQLIKIDCDGLDQDILSDLFDSLGDQIPCILFENTIRNGQDLRKAEGLLTSMNQCGYSLMVATRNDGQLVYAGSTQKAFMYLCEAQLSLKLRGLSSVLPYTDILIVHTRKTSDFVAICDLISRKQRAWLQEQINQTPAKAQL